MSLYDRVQESAQYIKNVWTAPFPDTVIVTGTGLSQITERFEDRKVIPYGEIPHFPKSTVESHKGNLHISEHRGKSIAVLAGRWHYYEGYTTQELTLPIRVMKALGVKNVLFTNVAGGINPYYNAGDIVMLSDHINTIPDHPLRGPNDSRLGVRFPDMLHTYDRAWREMSQKAAVQLSIDLKEGVYYALQGPSLETPAEYKMIHRLGADLVGMSTVPEVIVAKHSDMKIIAFSIVSNECFPTELITETTIAEVIAVAGKASVKLFDLIEEII